MTNLSLNGENMSPINIISLSHSDDFDGIGSQSILHRYFIELKNPIPDQFGDFSDKEVSIHFFQADYQDYLFYWAAIFAGNTTKTSTDSTLFIKEFNSAILKLHEVKDIQELRYKYNSAGDVAQNRVFKSINIWKDMDLLIISDIGYNKTFKPLFKMLEEIDLPVVYFDHHKHDAETKEILTKYCRIYDVNEKLCTTQIVHRFFLPDEKISKFIGDLGADTDFGRYKMPTSKEIMSIISYHRKSPHILSKIIKNYSQGINLDADLKKEYQIIEKWENGEAKKMVDSLKEIPLTINEDKQVLVFFGLSILRSGRSMNHLYSYIQNKMRLKKSEEIIILFTVDSKNMNTNIKSDDTDVHKIAEHFGGGGHKSRAGFRFPRRCVNKDYDTPIIMENIKLTEFLNEVKKFL